MPHRAAFDVASRLLERAYARRAFVRAVWRLRPDVLLELTKMPNFRGERSDPLAYAGRERKIVETWAKRWHVAAPWLVDWAVLTRIEWHSDRSACGPITSEGGWARYRTEDPARWLRDRVEFGEDSDGAPSFRRSRFDVLDFVALSEDVPDREPLLDPLSTNTIEIDAPNPLLEDRETWMKRGMKQLEGAWLAAALDAENRGLVPATLRRVLDTHCEWTARYHIDEAHIRDIATHLDDQKADQRKTVESGIASIVRLLRLPPLRRRGRPRKS